MHTNINDNDKRITAYLKGKMTAEEEQAFLQEVKANPELKAQTIAIARMVKAMKVVGSERDKATIESLKKASSEDVKNATKTKVTPKIQSKKAKTLTFKRMLPWMGLAASVALIVWISVGRNNPVTEGNTIPQMANNPQQTTEDVITSRGNLTKEQEKVEKQLKAWRTQILDENFVKNEAKQIIPDLEKKWDEEKTKKDQNTGILDEIGLDLSYAYIINDQIEKAQSILDEIIHINGGNSSEEKKALEQLDNNKIDDAIETLKGLINNNTNEVE